MLRRNDSCRLLGAFLCLGMLATSVACQDDEAPIGDEGSGGGAATGGSGGSGGAGGSSATGGTGGGSAGVSGASGSSGSAGAAGGGGTSGGGGVAGAGGSAGAASGACNYLTQLGASVNPIPSSLTTPQAQGGAIVEGFYHLVAVNLYGGATGTSFWRTVRLVGNELKTVEHDGSATMDTTTTGTYVVSGVTITRSITCPATASASFDYTSTPTSFTAYEDQGSGKVAELIFQYNGT